jgi:hypothetical protein
MAHVGVSLLEYITKKLGVCHLLPVIHGLRALLYTGLQGPPLGADCGAVHDLHCEQQQHHHFSGSSASPVEHNSRGYCFHAAALTSAMHCFAAGLHGLLRASVQRLLTTTELSMSCSTLEDLLQVPPTHAIEGGC